MIFEVAHQMGLAPALTLGVLRLRGRRRDAAYGWLVLALTVSWLADWAAHWVNPWLAIEVYLVSQAGLIGLVFLARREAAGFAGVLAVTALVGVFLNPARGPDVLMHTVAWLGVVGIVADRPALGLLRTALLVLFGAGWVAWMAYAAVPGWWTWGAYQAVRASGLALFCGALIRPGPVLRVAR